MTSMLRTTEAATLLGLSPTTLATWRVRGGGPLFRKLGRIVVYDPADLRTWLDARACTSTSATPARPQHARPGRT
jgi:hypothetical protein